MQIPYRIKFWPLVLYIGDSYLISYYCGIYQMVFFLISSFFIQCLETYFRAYSSSCIWDQWILILQAISITVIMLMLILSQIQLVGATLGCFCLLFFHIPFILCTLKRFRPSAILGSSCTFPALDLEIIISPETQFFIGGQIEVLHLNYPPLQSVEPKNSTRRGWSHL